MTRILAVFAFSAATALAGSAQAAGFPNWPLHQTCKSGDSTCVRFEVFARGQISGTWNTLPPGARAICISETEKVEKSYRLLQDCLANVMKLLLANQQRNPPSGDVVNLTPKAKEKTPPPAPAAAAPAPSSPALPAKPLPVPQAGPITSAAPESPAPVPQAGPSGAPHCSPAYRPGVWLRDP